MYPRKLLITFGLAAFIGSLVVFAPLSFLLKLAPGATAPGATDVAGTLMDARVRAMTSSGEVTWYFRLRPAYLLSLGVGGDWQVEGADIAGHGQAVLRPWGYGATVTSGEISAGRLGALLGADGFETDRPLYLREVNVTGVLGSIPRSARGRLAWGPGDVRLRNRAQPVAVPALVGQLQTVSGSIGLLVGSDSAPDVPLMTASLDLQSRELHAVVLGRAIRLLGLSGKHDDDKAAFELRQTLP